MIVDVDIFLQQVFQTPEPLLQPVAAGQAELPQAAGLVPLQPTPVNTQSTAAQATSPTLGVPAASAVLTQVRHHYQHKVAIS